MDTQLQDIIKKIHSEGVQEAEERAQKIIEAAEKQAKERVDRAKSDAEQIRKDAERDVTKTRAAGEAALKQASRDLLLSVRKDLTALFETVQKEAVAESLTPERMAEIISVMVSTWIQKDSDAIEILLNEKDRDAVEKTLRTRLSEKLTAGYEVRPVRGISSGFRVGIGDSAAHYDFTDETIAELLSAYLNPRLAELMQSAGKE